MPTLVLISLAGLKLVLLLFVILFFYSDGLVRMAVSLLRIVFLDFLLA